MVTVLDPGDPWNRVWLTRNDGKRVLLLDQNDLPARILHAIVDFPGGVFLALFGPKI